MTLFLRRAARFSASLLAGGGHDYVIEMTVGGRIDSLTGMVVNIKDVDALLKAKVINPLDGKTLDRDLTEFREKPPTLENLIYYVWQQCALCVPAASALAKITLRQTPSMWAELALLDRQRLTLEGPLPVLTVTRAYDFSASHRLHAALLSDAENETIFGKCNWANGHGHNYEVEVTLSGEPDPQTGQIADYQRLDEIVDEEILKPFDHKHLNYDVPEFHDLNPTSENLTRVIWDKLIRRQPEWGVGQLCRVIVRETARNYFEYYGDQVLSD